MLVVGAALSTPLAAQQRGASWMVGLSATVGTGWQMEGADIGTARPIGLGPLRFASITARLGSFQDEGTFLFGARGFVAGLALATQTGSVPLIVVGSEENPISVALDLTFEATGYVASRSPFPQGDQWVAFGILPGIRTIQTEGFGASFMVGPVLFMGRETDVRTFLAFRLEIPVARGSAAP